MEDRGFWTRLMWHPLVMPVLWTIAGVVSLAAMLQAVGVI